MYLASCASIRQKETGRAR